MYIIYFLSKKSHITSIQTKWKECQCFDNLLKILNDNLESLTDPIIERIVCTLKVSYDLNTETNEEKDANDEYLFDNDQANKTNIYEYFKEIVFEEESILKNRMFRDAFIHFINMFGNICKGRWIIIWIIPIPAHKPADIIISIPDKSP